MSFRWTVSTTLPPSSIWRIHLVSFQIGRQSSSFGSAFCLAEMFVHCVALFCGSCVDFDIWFGVQFRCPLTCILWICVFTIAISLFRRVCPHCPVHLLLRLTLLVYLCLFLTMVSYIVCLPIKLTHRRTGS